MPIFDFHCEKCNTSTEKLVKHNDPAPKCDNCGEQMSKVLATPAFHFANGKGTDMGNTMSIAKKKTA